MLNCSSLIEKSLATPGVERRGTPARRDMMFWNITLRPVRTTPRRATGRNFRREKTIHDLVGTWRSSSIQAPKAARRTARRDGLKCRKRPVVLPGEVSYRCFLCVAKMTEDLLKRWPAVQADTSSSRTCWCCDAKHKEARLFPRPMENNKSNIENFIRDERWKNKVFWVILFV